LSFGMIKTVAKTRSGQNIRKSERKRVFVRKSFRSPEMFYGFVSLAAYGSSAADADGGACGNTPFKTRCAIMLRKTGSGLRTDTRKKLT